MSKKTLLVLAASLYQLDTIQTAKRLGYRVITTDNVPSNPGHALADKSYHIDTTDLEGVLAIALDERIDGIISPCTDVSVPTAAYVSERMGLVGPPYESTTILCDKAAFRDFLTSQGLPCPRAYKINRDTQLSIEISANQKWIIKPDKSSGSKGIFVLESASDFVQRLPQTLSFSPTGCGVIEEYISGHQGTCEGILRDGKLLVTLITDRQTMPLPYVATCGHNVPSSLSELQKSRLLDRLNQVFSILKITDGPFDCDFVATKDDVYLIEMTPRMGGNSLNTLWRKCYDFDIVEYSVKAACGQAPNMSELGEPRVVGLVLLGTHQTGKLSYDVSELRRLQQEKWVDYIAIDLPNGTSVEAFINGRHRVGEALIYAENPEQLRERIHDLKTALALKAEQD
ncbi:MAG: ATP-grasp domain-containing protein [Armatimonadetes bacterium]|jgi:biotin carboxylase|nr:ATP-grasp domain-containing protein [Armatimonadota bacterium]